MLEHEKYKGKHLCLWSHHQTREKKNAFAFTLHDVRQERGSVVVERVVAEPQLANGIRVPLHGLQCETPDVSTRELSTRPWTKRMMDECYARMAYKSWRETLNTTGSLLEP